MLGLSGLAAGSLVPGSGSPAGADVVGVVGVTGVGHAKITGSEPAAGSVVERAPDVVTLSVDAKPATVEGDPLQVYAPDGRRIDDGRISLADEGRRIAVGIDPTQPRPAGRYEIVYRIVSADTHIVIGRLPFETQVAVPAVDLASRPAGAGPRPTGQDDGLLHGWPDEAWPPAVAAAALALVAVRVGWRRWRRRRAIEAGPRLLPPMQGHRVAHLDLRDHHDRRDRRDRGDRAERVGPG